MSEEITHYVDEAMFDAAPMPDAALEQPQVTLLWMTPDPLGAVAAACKMYKGEPVRNLADITDDERRHYWEEVQKTHLKAPLEFIKLHFFIEGVTRANTHQQVRQRTAVFAQESLRFAVKPDLRESVRPGPEIKGDRDREQVYYRAIDEINEAYQWLIGNGVPAETARGLLPHDTLTRDHYCTDMRNLLEHAGNRLCTQAQFEWRAVFLGIVQAINDYDPPHTEELGLPYPGWQFPFIAQSQVFKPICFMQGQCMFGAEFDRQCTIRERVQRGAFNEIHPAEYMADPTAGRRDG